MMRTWTVLVAATALMVGGCLTGCVSPNAMPKEFAALANGVVDKIAEQGMLERWQADMRTRGLNPGIAVRAGIYSEVKVGLDGVYAEAQADVGGDSTRLPDGLRDELIRQLSGPISDEQRAAILAILGWNRTPDGGTPTAPTTTTTTTTSQNVQVAPDVFAELAQQIQFQNDRLRAIEQNLSAIPPR